MATGVQLRFGESLVRRGAQAETWRDAVKTAGDLLVTAGCARRSYPDKLIGVIEKYGPYMVIAPNLALVHAQPGPETLERGLAAVTFPDGVNFGHAHYDPVGLVIAITTTNAAEHLDVVAGIATALDGDEKLVSSAVRAKSDEALVELLRKNLPALRLGE